GHLARPAALRQAVVRLIEAELQVRGTALVGGRRRKRRRVLALDRLVLRAEEFSAAIAFDRRRPARARAGPDRGRGPRRPGKATDEELTSFHADRSSRRELRM